MIDLAQKYFHYFLIKIMFVKTCYFFGSNTRNNKFTNLDYFIKFSKKKSNFFRETDQNKVHQTNMEHDFHNFDELLMF